MGGNTKGMGWRRWGARAAMGPEVVPDLG